MIGPLIRLTFRGIGDMRLHPWAQFLTLVAVTMITLLAGVVMLVLFNVNQELIRNRGQVQFQVYWSAGADAAEIATQWAELSDMEGLKEISTYTPDQALADLADTLGEAGDFAWLTSQNPLPPSAILNFAIPEGDQDPQWAPALLARLKNLPGVERVHYNPMQMDLAHGWLRVTQTVVWPVIGFLALVVALVVGNTIKLSQLTRRDEVEILSLVGARRWYIRWPLLTGGAVLGLLGSGMAVGLLRLLQHTLQDVLNVPPLYLTIRFLPLEQAGMLAGAVTLMCVMASWVAVRS